MLGAGALFSVSSPGTLPPFLSLSLLILILTRLTELGEVLVKRAINLLLCFQSISFSGYPFRGPCVSGACFFLASLTVDQLTRSNFAISLVFFLQSTACQS
jgi:hypothetical protein